MSLSSVEQQSVIIREESIHGGEHTIRSTKIPAEASAPAIDNTIDIGRLNTPPDEKNLSNDKQKFS